MTSIKPKGPHTPGATTPESPTETGAAHAKDAPRETFRETLDAPAKASQAAPTGPLASIRDDLRAGKIDAAGAIDRLVARALSAPEAAALPPARKAELEAHLRAALADDPTLVAMTKDLERAS